jgi:hypothetical protein
VFVAHDDGLSVMCARALLDSLATASPRSALVIIKNALAYVVCHAENMLFYSNIQLSAVNEGTIEQLIIHIVIAVCIDTPPANDIDDDDKSYVLNVRTS